MTVANVLLVMGKLQGGTATVIVPIGTVAASVYRAGSRQVRLHHSGSREIDVFHASTKKGGK